MHSRSSDAVDEAIDRGAARIVDAVVDLLAVNPVILIDGRSGAGKTSLARRVVQRWPISGLPQLISLDSLYPGWDGLDAGVHRATERILVPHARSVYSTWNRWDWEREEEAESYAVDPAFGVILEGCGALTPTTARLADICVWVEAPDDVRRARALGRDGEAFEPHWDRWAAQEAEHIARDDPRSLATLQVAIP